MLATARTLAFIARNRITIKFSRCRTDFPPPKKRQKDIKKYYALTLIKENITKLLVTFKIGTNYSLRRI